MSAWGGGGLIFACLHHSRRSLNKNNLLAEMFKWYKENLYPLAPPKFIQTLKYMLHSGEYMPNPQFAQMYTRYNYTAAALLWKYMFFPESATEEEMTTLFLKEKDVEMDARYESMPLLDAKEHAREARMCAVQDEFTLLGGDIATDLLAKRKLADYDPGADEYDDAVEHLCPHKPEHDEYGYMSLRSKRPAVEALSPGTTAILKRRTIRTEVDKIAAAAVEGDVSDLSDFFDDKTGTAAEAPAREEEELSGFFVDKTGATVGAPAREEKLGFRSNSFDLSGGGQTKLCWSPKQDKS